MPAASRLVAVTTCLLAACAEPAPLEPARPRAYLRAQDAGAPADVGAQPRCVKPPDCTRVLTIGFQMDTCCTKTLACGIDFSGVIEQASLLDPDIRRRVFPPELSPSNTCLHPSRLFVPDEGPEEARVKVRGAADILLTPECATYNMFSFPLPGCCLPTGRCGMSSHFSISNVIPFVAPGSEATVPQCFSPAEFRRQLKGSAIERLSDPPEITATCDYAALDARLPQAPEPPPDEPVDLPTE